MRHTIIRTIRPSSDCIVKLRLIGGRRFTPLHSFSKSRRIHTSLPLTFPRSHPRPTRSPELLKASDREGSEVETSEQRIENETRQPSQGQSPELLSIEALGGHGGTGGSHTNSEGDHDGQRLNASSNGRRNGVTKKPEGIPPFVLPDWFLSENVLLSGEQRPLPGSGKHLRVLPPGWDDDLTEISTEDTQTPENLPKSQRDAGTASNTETKREARPVTAELVGEIENEMNDYAISHGQWSEIVSSIAAGLSTARTKTPHSFTSSKAHLRLHCPINGSIYFQDRIVEWAARSLHADLIRIDAQDLAKFCYDYLQEPADQGSASSYWSLSYDMQPEPKSPSSGKFNEAEQNEDEEEDDDEAGHGLGGPKPAGAVQGLHVVPLSIAGPGGIRGMRHQLRSTLRDVQNLFGSPSSQARPGSSPMSFGQYTQSQQKDVMWNDLKLNYMLQTILEANNVKRDASGDKLSEPKPAVAESTDKDMESAEPKSDTAGRKTIILIRDQKDMALSRRGQDLLTKLENKIRDKRRQGHEIVMVGTNASADMLPELSTDGMHSLQGELTESFGTTIMVTPPKAGPNHALFYSDERRRFKEMNVRNIIETFQRLDASAEPLTTTVEEVEQALTESDKPGFITQLEQDPMPYADVHRIASVAIGRKNLRDELQNHLAVMIAEAMLVLEVSDENKVKWLDAERGLQSRHGTSETQQEIESKQPKVKASNRYEKRLMNGIINARDIKTTFDKVHAPSETIEGLKTLTMLPLVRREAFNYGVLATDKLSGLLLYGPPGTGKTLLAKAVAKESGATVLEVTGSDIYNMFVGEGEKNVKAVFSLAKKLSPCVVFIDEADAIFASRGGRTRNSHRELINQFLREWDGITDTNAFIMVATNRPFDLDDAVLRRLPRRMLVDLPVEKDREAILRIHLQGEELADDVSIADLAFRTPLYSGSDLKNVAVSAALAAVREEFENKQKHDAEQSSKPEAEQSEFDYASKRVLKKSHFDKALGEISASVGEDMSSLSAIKKFDEQYGDRRGRKKKTGFGYGSELEGQRDTVKVRD